MSIFKHEFKELKHITIDPEKVCFYQPNFMYIGSFQTFCGGPAAEIQSKNGKLRCNAPKYGPITLQQEKQKNYSLIPQQKNIKEAQKCRQKSFKKLRQWKQKVFGDQKLFFTPMFQQLWIKILNCQAIKVDFYLNLPSRFQIGSIFVPIRIDIYIGKRILNQFVGSKNNFRYDRLVADLQKAQSEYKQIEKVYKKLQIANQKQQKILVQYKGFRFSSNPADERMIFYFDDLDQHYIYCFRSLFRQKDILYRNYREIQATIQNEKLVRLFLLHIVQKLQVKIINRTFIKPRPRTNFFISWFLHQTFGRQMLKQTKYNTYMRNFLRSPELKLLIVEEQHQKYYEDQIQSNQIMLKRNWLKFDQDSQQAFMEETKNLQQRLDDLSKFPLNWTQYCYETAINQRQEMMKQQLGVSKGSNSIEDKKIKEENDKIIKQFEEQNKYFVIHPTPEQMKCQLKPYQGQALQWMKYRQGKISVNQLFQETYIDKKEDFQYQRRLSPFWEEIELMNKKHLFLNYLTGQITHQFHEWKAIRGGILADQMGLGKTVMAISLMADDNFNGTNLVVAPVNVLKQWISELRKYSKKDLQIFEYHSAQNKRKVDLSQCDVIVTTYGTLGNQYKAYCENKDKENRDEKYLFDYQFRRVFLDEAQNIKSSTTLQAQGSYNLNAEFKWCLTGTLVQNSEQDLFSIFKFLGVEVFCEEYWWNTYIKRCTNQAQKFNIIHTVLRPIALRRTKQSKDLTGRQILSLPPKQQIIIKPAFSQQEQRLYKQLQQGIRNYFVGMSEKERNSFTHIFQIIVRLRQFCCHPSLVFKKSINQVQTQDVKKILGNFLKVGTEAFKKKAVIQFETEIQACPICFEAQSIQLVLTQCGHVFCQQCIKKLLQKSNICPQCRSPLNQNYIKKSNLKPQQKITSIIREDSSKIKAIVKVLQEINKRGQKCVIFSQWLTIIEILKSKITDMGLKWSSITGDMNKNDRARSVIIFRERQQCAFMIVSLRAGGTGLNLVMANNVMICDPWWNPAHQDQATKRVHRIGQEKQVKVYRFIMQNSIEEKIVKMHVKKRMLADKIMMKKNKKMDQEQNATEEMIKMVFSQ